MFREIVIIGHSFGGSIIVELARKFFDDFQNYVCKIFLSASSDSLRDDGSELSYIFRTRAVNYATSSEKLGTPIRSSSAIPQVKVTMIILDPLSLGSS